MNKKIVTKDICMIGAFTAVIAVLSWISIPMPLGIPTTLQTFAVPLAGIILGPKKGTIAVLTYVLIGAVGVPVFAGFSGGIGSLFGLSGGFIWAFPLMALCAGLGAKKGTIPALALGLLMGIIVLYSAGMFQFMLVTGSNIQTGFFGMVLPFMPTEVIKATLAATLGMKCRQALIKSGMVTA
jgi:biotin transport system substrate-specific component